MRKYLMVLLFALITNNAYANTDMMPHSFLCQYSIGNKSYQLVFKYSEVRNRYIEMNARRTEWSFEIDNSIGYFIMTEPRSRAKITMKIAYESIDDLGIATVLSSYHSRNEEIGGFCLALTRH